MRHRDCPRALLFERLDGTWLDRAFALGCVAGIIDHPALTLANIAADHGAGMRILAYTVNKVADVTCRLHAWLVTAPGSGCHTFIVITGTWAIQSRSQMRRVADGRKNR